MFGLDNRILLFISFAFAVVSYISNTLFAKKISRTKNDFFFFMMLDGTVCALTIFLLSGGIKSISPFSVIFGIIFGFICLGQMLCNLKAFSIGPFSYTTILVALSTVIPTIAGTILSRMLDWEVKQSISLTQWLGIAFMIVCIMLSPDESKDDASKRVSTRWFLYTMEASILNGFIGVSQMIHQKHAGSQYATESPIFLLTAFCVLIFAALLNVIFRRLRDKDNPESRISLRLKPSHIAVVICAGASLGTLHVVNLYLSGVMPSAVLFPIINICPLIITTIIATIIFKERLSLKRKIGIVIGVIAMTLISGIIKL